MEQSKVEQPKADQIKSEYKVGQHVDLEIVRETPLGFVASINSKDEGLLYHNEVFEKLQKGDRLPGFIRNLREDGGIDLILTAIGHHSNEQIGVRILEVLEDSNGKLAINSKTSAEEIYRLFGVSKKKYKMALGGLYKQRLVKISDECIELARRK